MKLNILTTTALLFVLGVASPVKAASAGFASSSILIAQNRDEERSYDDINQIYREVLDRDADYRGLRTWSRQLEKGASLDDIREEIARSPEAENKVKEIYAEVLGRQADLNGLRTWTNELADGSTLGDVREKIANSREAEDAINRLYQQVLGRQADRDGLRTWKRELADGMSLRELRREISSSREARERRRPR